MAKFLDLTGLKYFWNEVKTRIDEKVSSSRKINGKALSSDITLSASDVGAVATSQVGTAGGVASLDTSGKVPTAQLPSYVDDVLEYDAKANFPTAGESGKIYVDMATNKTYRWSGSAYVEISASLALGTTASTAYRGDYGNTAYQHSQAAHAPTTAATSGAMGLMSAADKAKLDGIAEGANAYTLPTSGANTLGGVKTGANITNTSGTISLTKQNVVDALGYTPGTSNDNNTTYTLVKEGTEIKLVGSDGKTTSVTDADNDTTYESLTETEIDTVFA